MHFYLEIQLSLLNINEDWQPNLHINIETLFADNIIILLQTIANLFFRFYFAESVLAFWNLESKKHLSMMMKYIEGEDCANMLKNMGPFPHVRYTS